MRTNKFTSRLLTACAALGLVLVSNGSALSFDPEKEFKPDDEPRTIVRFGFNALKRGDMAGAVGAFRFGAERNDLASQWKLARMLQSGTGVDKDHYAAFQLYAQIANRFVEKAPTRGERGFVADSVVWVGKYSLTGIKNSPVKRNLRRAEDQFYRAAALYHDPIAQFELGRLYRSGKLGVKQPRSAIRWLGLAARKGHSGAQAELGEMLFYGEGVPRRPVRGLVYMTRAVAGSARNGTKRLRKMRQAAFTKATQSQRDAANNVLSQLKINTESSVREFGFTTDGQRSSQGN